jgi:hypothetical protein
VHAKKSVTFGDSWVAGILSFDRCTQKVTLDSTSLAVLVKVLVPALEASSTRCMTILRLQERRRFRSYIIGNYGKS